MKQVYLERDNEILSRIIIDKELLKELLIKHNMTLIKAQEGIFSQCGIYDPSLSYYYYTFDNISEEFFNELEEKLDID